MIIIVCPDIVTGGPESLHFLCNKLNYFGIESRIHYVNYCGLCAKAYENYNCPKIDYVEDTSNNIIIVPETLIDLSFNYKKSRIIVFWLSLEYFIHSMPYKHKLFRYLDFFVKPKNYFNNSNLKFNISVRFKNTSIIHNIKFQRYSHICNSYFAYNFCKSNFENVELLRIPINIPDRKKIIKDNVVLYNPKKKPFFTFLLKFLSRNIKFKAVIKLDKEKVFDLMASSKIYIDFGNHPGRERMPREAAMLDCLIITNRCGSAFGLDLPILEKYKINEHVFNVFKIINTIKDGLKNYDVEILNFREYKESLLVENLYFDEYLKTKIYIFN